MRNIFMFIRRGDIAWALRTRRNGSDFGTEDVTWRLFVINRPAGVLVLYPLIDVSIHLSPVTACGSASSNSMSDMVHAWIEVRH